MNEDKLISAIRQTGYVTFSQACEIAYIVEQLLQEDKTEEGTKNDSI